MRKYCPRVCATSKQVLMLPTPACIQTDTQTYAQPYAQPYRHTQRNTNIQTDIQYTRKNGETYNAIFGAYSQP